jgi:hypothetical protein
MNNNQSITNINDLPTSQNISNNQNNISINTIDNQNPNQMPNQMSNQMPNQIPNQMPNQMSNQIPNQMPNSNNEIPKTQNDYNEMILQLQMAKNNNATNLPSRDIPSNVNNTNITTDEQIKPNYIDNNDEKYINNLETPESVINKNNNIETFNNNLEYIYNEIQIPIVLSILYFIFQLPNTKMFFYKVFPFFYMKDLNLNLYGSFAISLIFAILFYFIFKIINNITNSI